MRICLCKDVVLSGVNYSKTLAGVQTGQREGGTKASVPKERLSAGFTHLHIPGLPLMGMATTFSQGQPCVQRGDLIRPDPGIWPLLVSTLSSRTTHTPPLHTLTGHPTSAHSALPAVTQRAPVLSVLGFLFIQVTEPWPSHENISKLKFNGIESWYPTVCNFQIEKDPKELASVKLNCTSGRELRHLNLLKTHHWHDERNAYEIFPWLLLLITFLNRP